MPRAADLGIMRELGVTRINTVSLDPSRTRSFDQFGVLAELAGSWSAVRYHAGAR
jgi:hypothetical protein